MLQKLIAFIKQYLPPVREMLKDSLTHKDGDSYDWGRICGALGVMFYLGAGGWQLRLADAVHVFPFVEWGTGFGVLLAGTGIGLAAKAKTEPDAVAK